MLARPTTEQILLDVRAELLSTIDAAVTEPAVKVAIQMMENVLRNCAERAAHEIAWMRDETAAMVEYAEQVSASPAGSAELRDALASFSAGRSDSLHLDDVTATYSLAGECLSTALEAVLAAGDDVLHVAGRRLLEQRLVHEQQIMGEWTMVGRA